MQIRGLKSKYYGQELSGSGSNHHGYLLVKCKQVVHVHFEEVLTLVGIVLELLSIYK